MTETENEVEYYLCAFGNLQACEVWGKREFDHLKMYELREIIPKRCKISRTNFQACFVDVDTDKPTYIAVSKVEDLNDLVFKDEDHYLRFLTSKLNESNALLEKRRKTKVNNTKRKLKKFIFDDFLQNMILESQENRPEAWI